MKQLKIAAWLANKMKYGVALLPSESDRIFGQFTMSILRTAHGGFLSAGEEDGEGISTVCTRRNSDGALLCAIHVDHPELGFFLHPEASLIKITADQFSGALIPVNVLRPAGSFQVAFRHALSPSRYLGAVGSGDAYPEGSVVFDRGVTNAWEVFALLPWDHATLSPKLLALLARLSGILASPVTAATVLATLQQDEARSLFGPLLRILPTDELTLLARSLVAQPGLLDQLALAMPADRWATQTLPALLAWQWQPDRTPVQTVAVGNELDGLASESDGACRPSNGLIMTTLVRALAAPRRTLCVVASARNEGVYLLEWIAYHRSIGVEHFFLYSNANTDGSDVLLGALAKAGVITWLQNTVAPGVKPQVKAYGHAFTSLPDVLDFRWTLVLDIDEYLSFDRQRFASAQAFLHWQDRLQTDAIALCWLIFGSGRASRWSDAPLNERFVFRDKAFNPHVKSVFKTKAFWHSHAHHPYPTMFGKFIFRNDAGGLHVPVPDGNQALAASPSGDFAWINHYYFKSAEEFGWKVARGRGTDVSPISKDRLAYEPALAVFLANWDDDRLIRDDRASAFHPGTQSEMVRLLALAGVANAQAALKQHFVEQLPRLAHAFSNSALGAGDTGRAFSNVLVSERFPGSAI